MGSDGSDSLARQAAEQVREAIDAGTRRAQEIVAGAEREADRIRARAEAAARGPRADAAERSPPLDGAAARPAQGSPVPVRRGRSAPRGDEPGPRRQVAR